MGRACHDRFGWMKIVTCLLLVWAAGLSPLPAHAQRVKVDVFPVPTPGSRPYTLTVGLDGSLYFTESLGDKIGRITPDGIISEFPVPTPDSGPYGIATGADGNIWFTERFADQIGRLDPKTGQIDEFPVLTAFSQPWEITAGPDGNLWFTEENVDQIGYVTLTGDVTEFPAGCCFPTGITAGPDGNLWYTIEIGDVIGRISPNGSTTYFPINPENQLLLWDIVPGPDGHLWFTELAGRSVGRVSTTGQFDRFPVPGEFSGITGITAGPDGLMWFTENDTARIGSMRTNGRLRLQQDVTPESRPLNIVHGPDGNAWFVMADGNAIGRIHRAQRRTAYVLSMDAGFTPPLGDLKLGSRVQWTFLGPREHAVTDASGLGLFDSGQRSIVSYFRFDLQAAATYAYGDPENGDLKGEIPVPVRLPRKGRLGEAFAVTWALQAFPPDIVFDVEVKAPGEPGFQAWQDGIRELSAPYTPLEAGTFEFRARLRRSTGPDATRFSPPARIRVSG